MHFAMKNPLKSWNLAIKWCSSCFNCFIISMTPVCYFQNTRCGMVYFHACLFSPHMCYNYWFTVYMNANGADLHLPNCRQNLLIDIPETCFTFTKSKTNFVNWYSWRLLYFLWWIQISFFPTVSYTPVLCFAHILSCRQNVSGGHLLMSMLELIKLINCVCI